MRGAVQTLRLLGLGHPVPYWNQNEVNTTYARQATVSSGGAIVVNNPLNYRDYARAKTSGATAQQTTVQGTVVSSRYHNPGNILLTDGRDRDWKFVFLTGKTARKQQGA